MTRRDFLRMGSAAAAVLSGFPVSRGLAEEPAKPSTRSYRACVIGHGGRGDYGHSLDRAFQRIPQVSVVAVGDPQESSRLSVARRIGAARMYIEWREMLAKEKPDLVAIGPTWVEERLEMVTAAAEAGAHVYMEKPMAASLEEADAILLAAEKHRTKLAVAHHARVAPVVLHLKKLLDGGLIGDLLEMRARGKEDHRAGGEDLMMLGPHCFYLMRYFGGEPAWCFARVTEKGRDVTVEDRRAATQPMGPVAGDSVHASYAFPGGVQGYFASQKARQGSGNGFGVTLFGSKGVAQVHISLDPEAYYLSDPSWSPGKSGAQWQRLPGAPRNEDPSGLTGVEALNKRIVEDLIQAIEAGKESVASGYEGRAALEMILAVYESHLQGKKVALPLKDRKHPLGSLG